MPFWFAAWFLVSPVWWAGGVWWAGLADWHASFWGCVFFWSDLAWGCSLCRWVVLFRVSVACPFRWVGCHVDIYGEFDSGSGRTLAACLTHASRTVMGGLAPPDQWRTGE